MMPVAIMSLLPQTLPQSGGDGSGSGAEASPSAGGMPSDQAIVFGACILLPALGTLALAAAFGPKMCTGQHLPGDGGSRLIMGVPAQTAKTMAVLCLWGFLCCTAGGMCQSPLTELLMQRACERQGIPFGTHACDHSTAAQNESTYRNTYLTLTASIAGFVSLGVVRQLISNWMRSGSLFYCMCVLAGWLLLAAAAAAAAVVSCASGCVWVVHLSLPNLSRMGCHSPHAGKRCSGFVRSQTFADGNYYWPGVLPMLLQLLLQPVAVASVLC